MKKLLALILSVCVLLSGFAFGACAPAKEEGSVYVGLECGYIPFNWTQTSASDGAVKISNADGYANGYDVMIAKKIADKLGKKLVIVKYDWDALISGVTTGALDFIIAGMSPTEERKESIDFSQAYYESQLVIVVKENGPYAGATTLADFAGAKITAQQGTFHLDALQAQGPAKGINVQTAMSTFPEMTAALSVGTIDGYVAEEPGAIADCAATSGLTYVHLINNVTGFTATPEDTTIAIGFKKNSKYSDPVNEALSGISEAERAQMMETAIALSVNAVD